MGIQDVNVHGFYSPVGLKCYISTHIQLLEINGSEVVFRFKDEYRAYYMRLKDFLSGFESICR